MLTWYTRNNISAIMKIKLSILLTSIMLFLCGSLNAQTLLVQDIETRTEEQTEMVICLVGGNTMTAMQFYLQLPSGITATTNNITFGTAIDGHTLAVETLDSGDLLFVLYNMDLKAFKDGELLRVPLTVGNEAVTASGKLSNIHAATADAVSHICENTAFAVTIINSSASIQDKKKKKGVNKAIDLQGRLINYPSKGIIIKDGRKEFLK